MNLTSVCARNSQDILYKYSWAKDGSVWLQVDDKTILVLNLNLENNPQQQTNRREGET